MAITYNYRYNTGTHVPDWTAWSPNVSTVCSGTTFQQQKDDLSGICESEYQDAIGSWAGDTWTPDVSAVCVKLTPSWSAWTPDASTVCVDELFTQTRIDLNDKCSPENRYDVTGTMLDCECAYLYSTPVEEREEVFIPISKSQYESYYRGGTWSATTSFLLSEYLPGSNNSWSRSDGSATLIYTSDRKQGCDGGLYFRNATGLARTYTNYNGTSTSSSTQYSEIYASMDYGLVKSGTDHFFVIYYMSCTNGRIYIDPINFPCAGKYGAYPPSVALTIEGVTITGVGTWCPQWANSTTYVNSSVSTASFTFNPSPRP
jgi:hypothetical protein